MPSFKSKHRVAHPASDMFDLVADIERYPQFVPLCKDLHVRGRREMDGGKTVLVADMTVAYKLFSESFTCRVTLDREALAILVEYLDGPFRHLENRWSFRPRGEGEGECDVEFFIEYEFRSRTLGTVMGAMFERAFRKFSVAFEARADEVYGTV